MEPCAPEVGGKLDANFLDLLEECRVPQGIAAFLADKGIVQIGAFSDLPDSKRSIVEVLHNIGAPIDPTDILA